MGIGIGLGGFGSGNGSGGSTSNAADLTEGVLDNARVQESNVTQHQSALTVTTSQISDFVSSNGGIADKVADYAALITLPNPQDGDLAYVIDELRYGLFRYDSNFVGNNGLTENGGTFFNKWIRVEGAYLFVPRYWGVVSDWDFDTQTGTDDTVAYKAMIAALPNSGENINAFADPVARIVFEPNKRSLITDELTISDRNLVIDFRESSLFNGSADKFAINLNNTRGVQLRDLNIVLLNDNIGVGGVKSFRTYNTTIDNVDIYANVYVGARQVNTVGYRVESGVSDAGDNLYNKYTNFLTRKIGTGFYAETADGEGDFSRTNSNTIDNAQFLDNNISIHTRGVWGLKGTNLDLESHTENFRFETNDQGLGSRYNKFEVNWTEGAGLTNFADAGSFDNEIELLYYGNVKDGIIPGNEFTFNLNNQNVTYGDLKRNEDFGFNLVRVPNFSEDIVWIDTNAQITGGQGILNVTADSFSQLEYLIKFTDNYWYEVEVEAYSDLAEARLRAVDNPANTGGLVAGVEAGKTQGIAILTTTPETYKFRFKANSTSKSLSLVRGGGDGTTTTYDIFINSASVKRIIPTTEEVNSWKDTQTFEKTIVATNGIIVPNAPVDSFVKADGTTGIPSGGSSSSGDFLANGTIAMTGDFNTGGNRIVNGIATPESFGENLLPNGDFTNGGTNWSFISNVTFANNQATLSIPQGGTARMQNLITLETGTNYVLNVNFTASDPNQTVRIFDNGANNGAISTANGNADFTTTGGLQEISIPFTATANSVGAYLTRASSGIAWNYVVDFVEIREVLPATEPQPVDIANGLTTDGDVTATSFIGDGSQLINLPSNSYDDTALAARVTQNEADIAPLIAAGRTLDINIESGFYTLVSDDAAIGKITIVNGDVTIPAGIFDEGDVVHLACQKGLATPVVISGGTNVDFPEFTMPGYPSGAVITRISPDIGSDENWMTVSFSQQGTVEAAFNPNDLTGLAAWYDPSDEANYSLTAGDYSTIVDKSGNSRDVVQTTASQRPTIGTINGINAMSFDGSLDNIGNTSPFMANSANGVTMTLVLQSVAQADKRPLAEGSSSSNNPIYSPISTTNDTTGDNRMFIRNDANAVVVDIDNNNAVYDGAAKVITLVDTGSEFRYYINGVLTETEVYTRSGTITVDRFTIGGLTRATIGSVINGQIGEVIIYDRSDLTLEEIGNINTYLSRWIA